LNGVAAADSSLSRRCCSRSDARPNRISAVRLPLCAGNWKLIAHKRRTLSVLYTWRDKHHTAARVHRTLQRPQRLELCHFRVQRRYKRQLCQWPLVGGMYCIQKLTVMSLSPYNSKRRHVGGRQCWNSETPQTVVGGTITRQTRSANNLGIKNSQFFAF